MPVLINNSIQQPAKMMLTLNLNEFILYNWRRKWAAGGGEKITNQID